ncbi:uncharacterized protein [Typha latifolia]|uniref:uncharacterized protein n=1 Tax=Typha latifolia TaxID=4733 RepID=UPI003C2E72B0
MLSRAGRVKFRKPRKKPHPPPPPPPRLPHPFLSHLKSISDPSAAASLLLSSPPHLLDYPSCSSVLHRLARARLFPSLHSLLSLLRLHRVPCQEPIFNSLIHHFGTAGLPDDALRLFHSIPAFSCPPGVPTTQTFNFLLNALVDNSRLDEARSLLSQCRKLGVRPNAVSYNIIIKGVSKSSGFETALDVLDEMVKRGVRPSVVSYNILIGFTCRNGRLEEAMRLKEEMWRKGVRPNAVTFASLMECLCAEGRYEAAKKMMFDMEYQGCKAELMNYGVLMSDRGRRGNFEGLKELLAEMKKRKMKPDVIKGSEPTAPTYRMLVDGCCRAREFEMALRILNATLASKHCPRPESFRCLMKGLCECGRMDDACYLLEQMETRKIELGANEWSALVQAIALSNDSEVELLSYLVP